MTDKMRDKPDPLSAFDDFVDVDEDAIVEELAPEAARLRQKVADLEAAVRLRDGQIEAMARLLPCPTTKETNPLEALRDAMLTWLERVGIPDGPDEQCRHCGESRISPSGEIALDIEGICEDCRGQEEKMAALREDAIRQQDHDHQMNG